MLHMMFVAVSRYAERAETALDVEQARVRRLRLVARRRAFYTAEMNDFKMVEWKQNTFISP
jgi:hypothetical protein